MLSSLLNKPLAALLPLSLLICGCGDDVTPPLAEGAALPSCKRDGRTYSKEEVFTAGLNEMLKRGEQGCSVSYASIADLLQKNPNCCQLIIGQTADRHSAAGQPSTSAGYKVGRLAATYLCNSKQNPQSPYRSRSATVTSCGLISDDGSADIRERSNPDIPIQRFEYREGEQ